MPTPIQVDCAIIGSGQGGALARMLAEKGRRVAIIDRGPAGGTCVNRGCTPTKARVSSARRAYELRTAPKLGIYAGEVKVNLEEVVRRSNAIVASFRDGTARKLEALEEVTFLHGTARFTAPHRLQVDLNDGGPAIVEAQDIVIATGVRPAVPEIEGLEGVPYFDSTTLLEVTKIPEHLIILGGGYIACEYGQMFARFGSVVTMLQSGPQILGKEDPDVSDDLAAILAEEGIEIRLNAKAERVEKLPDGVRVHCDSGPPVKGSHLLVATGQRPNTEELNLAAAGLETDDKGYIQVDEFLQAGPGLYGLGDVKGGPAFTHISYDDARILARRLCEGEKVSIKDRVLPYVVFTDPQLGRVGLNERQAARQGLEYRVAHLPIADTARGIETGDDKGFFKVLVAEETERILGCSLLCKEGGELMTVIQMAMQGRIPYTDLRDGIFAHPTQSESFNNLFLATDRQEDKDESPGCKADD